jgi:hypothetical protein
MSTSTRLCILVVVPLAMLAAACGSSSSSKASGTTSTTSQPSTTTSASGSSTTAAGSSSSFCSDFAAEKSQLLTWSTSAPGSPAAAADPLATAYQKIAAEAPGAVKAAATDLASTFKQLEKYDNVSDPNTLLQEGPLTTKHVIPDSNTIATYVAAHC